MGRLLAEVSDVTLSGGTARFAGLRRGPAYWGGSRLGMVSVMG